MTAHKMMYTMMPGKPTEKIDKSTYRIRTASEFQPSHRARPPQTPAIHESFGLRARRLVAIQLILAIVLRQLIKPPALDYLVVRQSHINIVSCGGKTATQADGM
jgi:hypothetical protein